MDVQALCNGNEESLDNGLSEPCNDVIQLFKKLDGDLVVLGINGKVGLSLGRMAQRAVEASGVPRRIIGVSRFTDPAGLTQLQKWGIETISCDLTDTEAVSKLPKVKNVIYMVGRKFGTEGGQDLTWAMNTMAAGYTGSHFRNSRIVAFSTGCVYPHADAKEGGSTEETPPSPIGEYANSCLGRERLFEYAARQWKTKVLLYRLNYAVDLRYGVLHDIAIRVWNEEPVDNSVGFFNVIWQGDANRYALLSLDLAAAPPAILNVTGPELASVEETAHIFGKLMGRKVSFAYPVSGTRGFLSNANKSFELFGQPKVKLEALIEWQAAWIMSGGRKLNKSTGYQVTNGSF